MKLHEQRNNLEQSLEQAQKDLEDIINWMNKAPKFKVYNDSLEHMEYGVDVHYGVKEAIKRLLEIKNNLSLTKDEVGV